MQMNNLLCKIGVHDMQYVACWCDSDMSIAIQEYKCSRCGKTAWNFAHFDADLCKVLTRISRGINKVDCGIEEENCCANLTISETPAEKTKSSRKPGVRKQGADKSGANKEVKAA